MQRTIWVCLIVLASLASLAEAGPKDGRLDVYWVDVEGGAATLLVTPAGETILIDTGNPGRRDADRITQVVTKEAGLARIDHLIVTHYHGDHFGGASFLAKNLPIGTLYDNGEFEGQTERPSKDYLELKCERRVVIHPGDNLPLKQAVGAPRLSLLCVGTRQKVMAPLEGTGENSAACASVKTKERDGSDNANSVVSLVAFGPWKFFDAGDLTWNREAQLVCPKNLVGKVDVYQVTHHGLDSSNNPVVMQSLEPTVAVMNNGHTKGCLPEVFENLTATKSIQAIYQVHKNLRPDGDKSNTAAELIANSAEPAECKGHFIKLSVAPDGKTYTAAIPAHEHRREFETRSNE